VTVTASSPSITYGGSAAITPSYSPNIAPSTPATCDVLVYIPGSNVGTYTSQCSGASDPNYTFQYVDGSVTVGQRSLHPACTSYTLAVGDAAPPYLFSNGGSFFTGDGWSSPPTCSSAYIQGDPAEVLTISGTTGDAGPNYSVSPTTDGTLTVQ
jgi:hypothetical protein